MPVKPVTLQNWPDFERLFSARGSPHHCWCTPYRFSASHRWSREEKQEAMRAAVAAGTPVGVLAYHDDTVVGWCSVAPREAYEGLARSRSMPASGTEPTWTVLCLFVPRPWRRKGVVAELLAGAARYATENGAVIVEGWPHDTAGTSSRHRGRAADFEAAGFRLDGRRWVRPAGR